MKYGVKNFFLLSLVLFLKTDVITKEVVMLTDPVMYKNLVERPGVALVVFSTPSCGNCQQIKQPFAELVLEKAFDDISFGMVPDAASEEMMTLSQANNIQGVPTFLYFKDGKEVYRMVGGNNNGELFKQGIRTAIQKYLRSTEESVGEETTANRAQPVDGVDKNSDDMFSKVVYFFKKIYLTIGALINRIIATVTSWF